jgi:H+/Cl- antiporter ClcA
LLLPVIAAGVTCGVFGGLFSRLMLLPMNFREHALWRWRETHPILFAGGCGVFVALTGFISGGMSYGSGYTITAQVVAGHMELPWYAAPSRFLATLASYYSGIPGGIFAPSLAIGAAIGSPLTSLLGIGEGIPAFIALCMAGFLAAVTQAPITAAIIVMEMIDGHGMVISLMAVTLIAKAIASRISPELYQQLALGFLPSPQQAPAQQQPPRTP